MPSSAAAFAIERRFAAELIAIRQRVARELARHTVSLDVDDLELALQAFLPTAAALVAAGQVEAQQAAAAFTASYIAREAGEPRGSVTIAGDVAGRTSVGIPLGRVLASSLGGGIFTALRAGRSPADALRYAAAAAGRLASGEIAAAADAEVAGQAGRDPRVKGWRWTLSGNEHCAACLTNADGGVRPMTRQLNRHPGCDCIRSIRLVDDPGTAEHPPGAELFAAMTPTEQAAQFHTAGERKAEMVRSGAVTLEDLVRIERHASWRTIVVERSLAEVAP